MYHHTPETPNPQIVIASRETPHPRIMVTTEIDTAADSETTEETEGGDLTEGTPHGNITTEGSIQTETQEIYEIEVEAKEDFQEEFLQKQQEN